MKRNVRNIIIGLGMISIPLIGIGLYMITLRPDTNSASHIEIKNEPKNEVKTNSTIKENDISTENNTRLEVAASMHLMANGMVVAEDNAKDGVKAMTQDELNATYKLIQTLPEGPEKTNFIEIITRWKNCDFSQIVEDHNTVWKILGQGQPEGSLKGRAIKIYEPAIKPTINLIKRGDYTKDE